MLPSSNLNLQVQAVLEKCSHLHHLKQLQAHLITLGHGHTQFYASKLVRFCTLSLSNLAYARFIFDHLQSPNVFLYTAMITAYNLHSNHTSAFLLYREMVRKGRSKPNEFIFPLALKSCPEVVKNFGTPMLHAQIEKTGFGKYPVVQTALLDSYSRFSADIMIARQLFDEMSERNVVSWTAMVSGLTRVGKMGDAILVFEEMPEALRDTPSWNSIVSGCTQNGLFTEALSFFRRLVLEGNGNRPNQTSMVCALSACGHCGMLQLGKCIHGYMLRIGLRLDSFTLNALIDMYGKCGSLKEARTVFDTSAKRSLTCWNSIINSFALHGHWKGAISVFAEMLQQHGDVVKPDGVTFVGLLNACTHGGLVEEGLSYYDSMTREYMIEPEIQHYGCLIDLLGRAGRFNEMMEVVKGMRVPPDEVVWGSLLNACKIHGRTDLAEFALKKLIEMEPNNGGYYAMLANLCGGLEKWDDALRLRKSINEQNAYKLPGCSWIEIDKQVSQFYSVDKSHPKTAQIYSILESLVISTSLL
nr:pentatricopeptide repeat-containing protein At1g33350 [Ipomoea batatas]GMD22817.1 pentatricopeptide repeat-containing protein At1g33350 [Ipomoea batatas]